ncbi:hypothetical protein [Telmatospirillum sp.]|uniref:hypothetical protein n=1 Tax=Telmatospirillum sp. TaxID=2079197 RepID=UPI00284EC417|nr:hypothetical protein [Telmatospirillum sp.]MDR3438482.1 hypothetical protein [Telmatospirillum sp.]
MAGRKAASASTAGRADGPAVFAATILLSLLTACGPLPRPFEHQRTSPLLSDQRALAPVAVPPVDGAPGLAEAVAAGLVREEIAASATIAGDGFLVLVGRIRSEDGQVRLTWRLSGADGQTITEFRQPLPPGALEPAQRPQLAEATVHAALQALRGNDWGPETPPRIPSITIRSVIAPPGFDPAVMTRAMARALRLQGMAVTSGPADFLLEGRLTITPAKDGQDLFSVDWTLMSPDGHNLATVSQGSPVPHEQVQGEQGSLARDIAEAGAEGIIDVVRQASPHP